MADSVVLCLKEQNYSRARVPGGMRLLRVVGSVMVDTQRKTIKDDDFAPFYS
ncbi:MAG TPA: hypothetical protein VLB90_03035 [Pseudomonadales bacterium]|nr:hypothetical protein [Pseudomonadales bacterium]